ncbi:MAG TPA: hypothetical protein VH394_00070 [Thermoanaerobaculia bacterium]|jgi:hypothetical protein|nr:hypothetical protein [Thermoanaerobaculia bacterium]
MRKRVPGLILGLALLVWMAVPIALELRPPIDWEIPLGTVMNADPEPPWPMVLHAGESEAVAGATKSGSAVLLPSPSAQHALATVRDEPGSALPDATLPVVDLLALHQRRNE